MMKPELLLRAEPGRFVPATEADQIHIEERITKGAVYRARLTRPRSLPQNSFYWVTLANVRKSTHLGDEFPTSHHLHETLLSATGHCTRHTIANQIVLVPDSTSFASMGPDEFRGYFDRALDMLALETGVDPLLLKRVA